MPEKQTKWHVPEAEPWEEKFPEANVTFTADLIIATAEGYEGDYDKAQQRLVDSFSPATATLEHMATIALCAFANGDDAVYMEYKMQLDSYVPYEQVDLFAAGECTLEDIFLSGGGEVK